MPRQPTWSANVKIKIVGLKEFKRELRKMGFDLKDLTAIYREVAIFAQQVSRAAAPGEVEQAIRRRNNQSGAYLNVIPRPERALGVFMGAKRRFGWYAHPKYALSTGRQFEKWVGNQWDPGEQSGKPYYIGDAINNAIPEILDIFGDGIEDLASRAFPDGGVSITRSGANVPRISLRD